MTVPFLSVMVTSNFLGNYSEKLNINKNSFNIILDENYVDLPKVANSAGLEIEAFRQRRNLEWKRLSRIMLILSDVCDPSHITAHF